MSRIPPHGARIVGAWPAPHHRGPPERQAPARSARQVQHALLARLAGLARELHLLRARTPDVTNAPGAEIGPIRHA